MNNCFLLRELSSFNFSILPFSIARSVSIFFEMKWRATTQLSGILCVCLCLLDLGGCSGFTGYPENYQDSDKVLAANAQYLDPRVRAQALAPPNGMTPKQWRDEVVYARIEVIDQNYDDLERKLSGGLNGFEVAADLTALVLNGFGATTGSAATKAALAAASGGVIGAKSVISTDIFYQKTLPALLTQMRADRKAQLAIIVINLKNEIDKYPMGQALLDVQAYYIAGTLYGAVTELTAQAGAKLQNAEAAIVIAQSGLADVSARGALVDAINGLTDAQAIAVYKALAPSIPSRRPEVQAMLKLLDPNGSAASSGASARVLLNNWVVRDADPAFLIQVQAAIKSAQGT